MKKINLYLILILCISWSVVFGQKPTLKVGDNPATIDVSAALEVESTNMGFLPPSMTTAQRDAIVTPAKGLLVYNTSLDCLQVNKGTAASPTWECVGASASTTATVDCNTAGFAGSYVNGIALSGTTYSVSISNSSTSAISLTMQSSDLVLSGITGLAVGTPTPATLNLAGGASGTVSYQITGTPNSCGTLTGVWSKASLTCSKTVSVSPNLSCNSGSWTTAVVPDQTGGLVNGLSYTGTYSIPNTGGGCTFPPQSITQNGLTFSTTGGSIGASGNLTYTLSGTFSGFDGGYVRFTTSLGCIVTVGILQSCKNIKLYNAAATDGIYTIDPDDVGSAFGAMQAYCDMTTDGGGWTLIGIFNAGPTTSPTVTGFTSQNTPGVYSRPTVIALANVSSTVQLRSGNSSTSYAHKVTSTANALAIAALRNSSTAVGGAGTWHNGANGQFTVNSGAWDWTVSCTISPGFNGWPNMYHSCNNGGSVHWFPTGGRTSGGDPWAATFIK